MYPNFRYWAFLSYSHDDRRVAERLHRALEAYRIPGRLVGLDGPFGPVPARLHPVFRDRDELNAGGQLGPKVEHALAVSRSLIVLCTPAAAASTWVQAEITAFIRLQPDAPLFCALLAGTPLAASQAPDDALECLPAGVRSRFSRDASLDAGTPVAVDLREHGDGWRLAVHKIVAGLTGLPLDQLVQRDAQRRHRRMAWLSSAMLVVAIALGLLAVLAYRSRDEAREQRAQAEGLIEFMLVDLRKRLEPAGRLDALEAVGERALVYYDRQPLKALDPDSLGRRARALHLIGEIDARRGDIQGARSAFTSASASTAELLLREPDNPQRLYDHAQSVYWNGYIDWEYGDVAGAERAFAEYARLAGRLSAHDPANPEWLAEVGYAHSNLGSLLLEQGRAREAIPQFQQSLRIDRRRATLPGDAGSTHLDIGQDRSWLSSAYYANRELRPAISEREAELAIYDRMAKAAPDNALVKERRMSALRFLGELHLATADLIQAKTEIEQSIVLAEEQRTLDADNVAWQESLAKSRVLATRQARRSGSLHEAQDQLDGAVKLLADNVARDPEAWVWRVELQELVSMEQAAIHLQANRLNQAERELRASQQRLRETASDASLAARILPFRIANAAMQAELAERQKDFVSANRRWEQVIVIAGDRADRLDGTSAAFLVKAMRGMGRVDEASQLQHDLYLSGYRLEAPKSVSKVGSSSFIP